MSWSPVDEYGVSNSLRSPEERSLPVLHPGNRGSVAQGDHKHVEEGGVRSDYQYGSLFPRRPLAHHFDTEAQDVEDDVAAERPHAVLEERSPAGGGSVVPSLWISEHQAKSAGGPDRHRHHQGEEDSRWNQEHRADQEFDRVEKSQVQPVFEAVLLGQIVLLIRHFFFCDFGAYSLKPLSLPYDSI